MPWESTLRLVQVMGTCLVDCEVLRPTVEVTQRLEELSQNATAFVHMLANVNPVICRRFVTTAMDSMKPCSMDDTAPTVTHPEKYLFLLYFFSFFLF